MLGIKHAIRATEYSLAGLKQCFGSETAFRQECAVLVLLLAVVFMKGLDAVTGFMLVGAWLAVMAFELVNSALECAFDLCTQEIHPLVKKGKDMASAAVFLLVMFNLALWARFLFFA